ncbi:MAG: membrane protein insertion efficiency factor YidD [Ignavibacteriae bacterium]|nr:membrane protein insertion efficiency factor YidD [Ignavibacteriota bacterium]
MTTILITLVKLYKLLLSPLLPFNTCRYTPSCSEYAIEALNKHGWLRGTWLSIKRLSRCHRYHSHPPYDPVPEKK